MVEKGVKIVSHKDVQVRVRVPGHGTYTLEGDVFIVRNAMGWVARLEVGFTTREYAEITAQRFEHVVVDP